jgi:hypothetical protein
MKRRAEKGKLSGGPRPYRYRWVTEPIDGKKVSHLEVIAAEAAVVVRMFADNISGVSRRALARRLSEDGNPDRERSTLVSGVGRQTAGEPLYEGFIRTTARSAGASIRRSSSRRCGTALRRSARELHGGREVAGRRAATCR